MNHIASLKQSTALILFCTCLLMLLIINASSWNGEQHPCDEVSDHHYQGQINSEFNELYGHLNTNKSSSQLVKIFNTLVYASSLNGEQHPCDEVSYNSYQGKINSEFNKLYGHLNTNKSSSKLVKIFNTLVYGKQEIAYHVNKTWVCIDENDKIIIYGAAEESKRIVQKYPVSMRVV